MRNITGSSVISGDVKMKKRFFLLIMAVASSVMLTACGPSEEKVDEVQEKYVQLIEKHNQVVEIHKNVNDASLDNELLELKGKVAEVEAYNLADMQDDEIDLLIQIMDALIASYDGYLETLSEMKEQEEAAVRIPTAIALTNGTELSFTGLKLYEQGDNAVHVDVLENLEPLMPGQSLTGLLVQRNVDNTPWILTLTDSEGREYEIVIHGEDYGENVSLDLVLDGGDQNLAVRPKNQQEPEGQEQPGDQQEPEGQPETEDWQQPEDEDRETDA